MRPQGSTIRPAVERPIPAGTAALRTRNGLCAARGDRRAGAEPAPVVSPLQLD